MSRSFRSSSARSSDRSEDPRVRALLAREGIERKTRTSQTRSRRPSIVSPGVPFVSPRSASTSTRSPTTSRSTACRRPVRRRRSSTTSPSTARGAGAGARRPLDALAVGSDLLARSRPPDSARRMKPGARSPTIRSITATTWSGSVATSSGGRSSRGSRHRAGGRRRTGRVPAPATRSPTRCSTCWPSWRGVRLVGVPCPMYWAAKATAIGLIALRGRRSRSIVDTPAVLTAPTRRTRRAAVLAPRRGPARDAGPGHPGPELPFYGTPITLGARSSPDDWRARAPASRS